MKKKILLSYIILVLAIGCTNNHKTVEATDDTKKYNETTAPPTKGKLKHLNVNILLDLSDRIDQRVNPKQPEQKQRDISAIMSLCQAFKKNVNAFNAFKTKAKIKVFFYPEPIDIEIANIAKDLNVSCEAGNTPETAKRNKLQYQNLDAHFLNGLNKIYDLATKSGKYPGSNIFRFMKDQVNSCIEDTNQFRNVLVIFTDGYIYDQHEKYNEGKRFSYIEKSFDHFKRFRDRQLLANEFDQKNYGLIKVNEKLSGIEVLVLELSPPLEDPVDIDILKKYWTKWLNEMGVVKSAIYQTAQPINTEKNISDFLSY